MYITYLEREKKEKKSNDHQRQSDYRQLPHVTPNERGHNENDASMKTAEG